ncbi:MAG: phospholipase D-like domain-containing protein [Candidatus Altiarchaeota archaeon]|nr:phospholipase D-like domain-containing protein [Candidatus Altiarchaeota archaeon]
MNDKSSTGTQEELDAGEISGKTNTNQNPYTNIIDNKHQRLESVLKELLSKSEYAKIVSGYFYIEGFNLVSRYAQDAKIDIVIGIRTTKATKEEFGGYFKQNKEDAEDEFEGSLEDIEENSGREEILNLAELMNKRREDENRGIKFYIFKYPPLHAKVYYFGLKREHRLPNINSLCVFGSSNFTPSGLGHKTGNIEFNALVSESAVLQDIERWFDEYIVPNSEELNTDLLKIIGRYNLTESDKEEVIQAYITLLQEDIVSAYELTDFFTQLFDETLVDHHKKEFEEIFGRMNNQIVYKFIRKQIDPLSEIINPILSEKEVQRNGLRRLWAQVISEQQKDKHKKGKILEEFSRLFFSFDDGLVVDDVNLRTEDEEIDIVLKNKINDPFWQQLKSPFIFIECKNWSSKVGTDELKKFRTDVSDHGNLTNIGLFIAVNGFTKGINTQQIRVVKDDKILCAVEGKDIETFLNSKISLIEFLEELIKQSIK